MPLEGNRRITLRGRAPTTTSAAGASVETGPRPELRAWASREDRGGARRVIDDVEAGSWHSIFTVRHFPRMDELGLDESWELVDERGRPHAIERIAESTAAPGGAIWYRIFATRMNTGADNGR